MVLVIPIFWGIGIVSSSILIVKWGCQCIVPSGISKFKSFSLIIVFSVELFFIKFVIPKTTSAIITIKITQFLIFLTGNCFFGFLISSGCFVVLCIVNPSVSLKGLLQILHLISSTIFYVAPIFGSNFYFIWL